MRSRQRYTSERPRQPIPMDIAWPLASTIRSAAPGDIRLGVAGGIWTVLGDLGADPEQVIADGGHDPRIFDGPENFLSHAAVGRLYQHCAERTNCPHFGLLVGEKASLSSLGLVGMLMKSSDTLVEALRVLEAHLKFINRGAIVHLERHADTVVLSYSVYEPGGGEGVAQLSDGALAAALRVICELCGTKLEPSEVLIPRRQPADLEPYRRVFRAPVRFNEEAAALVFPAQWLDMHVSFSDIAAHEALELRLLDMAQIAGVDLRDQLLRMLRIELVKTKSSSSAMAHRLAIHRRTLNRRLKAEGIGFKTLADEVRFAVARQLLSDTDIPLAQIAAALDFSEPAAFTRAFQRWSGQAPSSWRALENSLPFPRTAEWPTPVEKIGRSPRPPRDDWRRHPQGRNASSFLVP
jgi:AraC-like DNA-binding protein